ncbi:MAG TPA: DedA family protein, partial [Erythrobacter sp.]|nr:DedA family protein [Erythrobacter sp.]
AHMGLWRFLGFTFAGAFIWNLLLVESGRRLAVWLAESQEVLGWITLGLLGLTLAGYAWRVVTWKPRAER